jgi:arylsulfatase A-like enzyme
MMPLAVLDEPKADSDPDGCRAPLIAFPKRKSKKSEPARLRDLVAFPLGISATIGLLGGVCFAIHKHFLDPAFIACSIGVDVVVQVAILLLALALAFITRRKAWTGVLLAIGVFCLLAIPDLVKVLLPGTAHLLAWAIGLIAAIQIIRAVNDHRCSRVAGCQVADWLIAVPVLAALCVLGYGRARENFAVNALPPPPTSPNVLVVIVDTLRADHLSTYGYARDTSPYLTQLAQQGVLFQNAFSPSSWTLPSHASMLTGLFPHDVHVETDDDELSARFPTLGGAMAKRGYRTAAFSANYLYFSRDHGFSSGFSHFEDFEQSLNAILEKVPLSQFLLRKAFGFTSGAPGAFFGVKNGPSAGKVDDDALAWIKNGGRPFFAVLNFLDVHEPVVPPEPWLNMFTADQKAKNESMYFPEACSLLGARPKCSSEQPAFNAVYDGAVRYVDASIQQLLAQLNQRGILQNTIVVITSDHGQELGEHGMYGHGKSLYLREIQVPLIIWKPGLVPASVRIPTPVSTADLAATILDMTRPDMTSPDMTSPDITRPSKNQGRQQSDQHPLPGRSLAALWRSNDPVSSWPEPFSQVAKLAWFDKDAPDYTAPLESIVTPEWHYIRQEDKNFLFDWKADPDEAHDLCAAQPVVCADLRTRLLAEEGSRHQGE